MKFPLGRLTLSARDRAAFTLIELLAVMAIILVLAGLILNIAGSAQYNTAKSRAASEIKAMETALESYKSDNGSYPSDSTNINGGGSPTCEVLDAQNVQAYKDPSTYVNASEFLYQSLAGYQLATSTGASSKPTITKAYMNFKPDQLHVAANATDGSTAPTPNSAYMYIIDPFGFSYGYSTIYAVKQAANNAQTPPDTSAIKFGYNPTYDLWSTGGYASGGKSTPTGTPQPASSPAAYSTLWIKNW